jgi:hypothetical protein
LTVAFERELIIRIGQKRKMPGARACCAKPVSEHEDVGESIGEGVADEDAYADRGSEEVWSDPCRVTKIPAARFI